MSWFPVLPLSTFISLYDFRVIETDSFGTRLRYIIIWAHKKKDCVFAVQTKMMIHSRFASPFQNVSDIFVEYTREKGAFRVQPIIVVEERFIAIVFNANKYEMEM
jgi:hypothetical protein